MNEDLVLNQFLVKNLASIIPWGAFLLAVACLFIYRKYHPDGTKRLIFTESLLRTPGQSSLEDLCPVNSQISFYLIAMFILPLTSSTAAVSMTVFPGGKVNTASLSIIGILCLGYVIFSLLKLLRLLKTRRVLNLRYNGEVAVGQALNRLMLEGYHVYHDFPAESANIDHIVVGEKGVFTVETRTQPKQIINNRKMAATVEYTGRVLHFPRGTDQTTIERAEQQATWLSNWLNTAIGEQLAARAMVAIPGWIVKRTSADGIPVVNPKQFPTLFEHIKPRPLDDGIVSRIVHQLDLKCRDYVIKSDA